MVSQMQQLCCEANDAREEAARRDVRNQAQLAKLNKAMARLMAQPGRRTIPMPDAAERDKERRVTRALVASLSTRPNFLYELWAEWRVGAAGKKAAKDFTSAERGKEK